MRKNCQDQMLQRYVPLATDREQNVGAEECECVAGHVRRCDSLTSHARRNQLCRVLSSAIVSDLQATVRNLHQLFISILTVTPNRPMMLRIAKSTGSGWAD